MKGYREGLTIIIIFLLALAVRVAFAWPALTEAEGFGMGDDDDYYRLAVSLAQNGSLADNGHLSAYRMPFFPITIAPFHYFLGTPPHAGQPLIVVLSALTCVGTYLLGRELFHPSVGLVAASLVIINVQLVIFSRVLMTETLFIFLVLAGMLALERVRKTQRWTWALAAGVILGLATLTRANFGPFVIFALAWLIFNNRMRIWTALRNAAIIAGIIAILWGAWVVRNYVAFQAFIPFTTQGGNAYYGIYNDISANAAFPQFGAWVVRVPPSLPGSAAPNEVTLDRLQKELAFAWMRAHPALAAKMALMQAFYFWWPDTDNLAFVALLPASLIGLVLAIRQRNQGVMLWLLLAGVFTLMAIVSVGVNRYQLPLHPLITVLAAAPLAMLWQSITARRARRQIA